MVQSAELVDTTWKVETPEGIDVVLHLAGPMPRFFAWVLDLLIRGAVLVAGSFVLSIFGASGEGLLLILFFGLEWLYPVAFEVLREGRTPGKSALGLKVLCADGTPVDWTSSVIRNLLRAADFLPLFNVFALVSMLAAGQFRRLGDLAAGTVVVYARRPKTLAPLEEALPAPAPIPLLLEEQRAIISFARRSAELSPERQAELAAVAWPAFAKDAGAQGVVAELRGIAAWLLGQRPKAVP